jgi:very-short-patch-repair endonuclease
MHTCIHCSKIFNSYDALRRHSGKVHRQHASESYVLYSLNGNWPTCGCGCGERVNWSKGKFAGYLPGHRAKINNPMSGKIHSSITRHKMHLKRQERADPLYTTGTCKICNVVFKHLISKPKVYCSVKCCANDLELTQQKLEKRKLDSIAKYGVNYTWQRKDVYRKARLSALQNSYQKMQEKWKYRVNFLFTPDDYTGGKKNIYEFKCITCDTIFSGSLANGECPRCITCFPKTIHSSNQEREVVDFIKQNYLGTILENDRMILGGHELDIYLPDIKLAIEFDGIYWHSELAGKDKHYHLTKTQQCEEQGIHLLHIFESEWMNKQDIVKAILLDAMKINTSVLYARKLKIKEVSIANARAFLNTNHLQGFVPATYYYGLYNNEELVSIMSFSLARYTKSSEWEIMRFSSIIGTTIVGGASRLFMHFVKTHTPTSIITYADRRYFTGDLYKTLGFVFEQTTAPSYYYFIKNGVELKNRVQFQKHKLSHILPKFNPLLTEWANMQINGYNRIWDCGQKRFRWSI